jgi:hypothetical protein
MKMAVLWDVAPCSLVQVYRRFGHRSTDKDNKRLWNVGELLPGYTAQHPTGPTVFKTHLSFREQEWLLETEKELQ